MPNQPNSNNSTNPSTAHSPTHSSTTHSSLDLHEAREAQSHEVREAALMAQLPELVAHAMQHAPAYHDRFKGVDAAAVTTREALAKLPVLRKHDLAQLQAKAREGREESNQPHQATHPHHPYHPYHPFAGYATVPPWRNTAPRVFASPGPLYEVQGQTPDAWRTARALYAAGIRAGDLVHNSFSYHLVPAGAMLEQGAHALGCTVFPAGTGQTETQLQALHDLQANAYVGTPSFLRILLEKTEALGMALPHLTKALVSGEACPPSLRAWFAERGVAVYQCYATAELGLIAYETPAREGLVLCEDVILEIVRPGTNEVVPDGEVGEVVVTVFNTNLPLIRFGTGDLSAVLQGHCPTGRTNTRIKGWMGRADQITKVRGMFVHPAQLHAILQRCPWQGKPWTGKARLRVEGQMAQDQLLLQIEKPLVSVATSATDTGASTSTTSTNESETETEAQLQAHTQLLLEQARSVLNLRAEVQWLEHGSLPNDGVVVQDARDYS